MKRNCTECVTGLMAILSAIPFLRVLVGGRKR